MGMLLARFFMLTSEKDTSNKPLAGFLSDIFIIILLYLIYRTLGIQNVLSLQGQFFIYHSVMPLFFVCIVYLVASEKGIIPRFLAIKFVRQMGRSSFYPYLLHIPFFAWIAFIAEIFINNTKLLHKPQNVWICIFILYMGSYVYVNKFKKKRKIKKEKRTRNEAIVEGESVKAPENMEAVSTGQ
jgi:peptidoglycan/LPS O-acetylase OafA/YrhL